MPKTHMGWAKRTIEKQKEEAAVKQKQAELQRFAEQLRLQQQARAQQLSSLPNLPLVLQHATQPLQHALHTAVTPQSQRVIANNAPPGRATGSRPASGPSGPNLPRTRISSEFCTGMVVEWTGKYGWIRPTQPLNHPQANRHGGKVYVARQDIIVGGVMGAGLTPGQTCRFRVYTDASGIGAEQCEVVD